MDDQLIDPALIALLKQRNEAMAIGHEMLRHMNKPSCLNCAHRHYDQCQQYNEKIPTEYLLTGCNQFEPEVPF